MYVLQKHNIIMYVCLQVNTRMLLNVYCVDHRESSLKQLTCIEKQDKRVGLVFSQVANTIIRVIIEP